MLLLDLPLEVLQEIVSCLVWTVGFDHAFELRLVCRFFDKEVQRAIYTMPTWDRVYDGRLPAEIRPPLEIAPAMAQRFVLAKMNTKGAEKLPLCREILRAADYLEHECDQKGAGVRREFVHALATAATSFQKYFGFTCGSLVNNPAAIIRKVSNRIRQFRFEICREEQREAPRPMVEFLMPDLAIYADPKRESALIAALLTGRWDLATLILQKGANGLKKTRAFGVPLQVAAAVDAREIVQTILAGVPTMDNPLTEDLVFRLVEKPYECALEAASEAGHKQLVHLILEDSGLISASEGQLDESIISAARNGHEDIALLLLKRRLPLPLPADQSCWDLSARYQEEPRFWHQLLVSASRGSCQSVLDIAIDRFSKEGEGWATTPLRTALYEGLTSLAQLLLSRSSACLTKLLKEVDVVDQLLAAIASGYTSTVEWLLNNGAKLALERCPLSPDTHPFCLASWKGRYDIVSLFLSRGADIRQNACGARALIYAASHGQFRVVRLLLGAGVSAKEALRLERSWEAGGRRFRLNYRPSGWFDVESVLDECASAITEASKNC